MVHRTEITLGRTSSAWWNRTECVPLGFRVLPLWLLLFFTSSGLDGLLSPLESIRGDG